MKSRILNPIGTFPGALLLTVLMAFGAAHPSVARAQAAPAAATAAAPATATITYTAQPTGSKMRIEGTAGPKNWAMESGFVSGSVEADPKFPESALTDPKAARPAVQMFTPVKSYKSPNSKTMDSSMYEYLKEPEFKKIEYRLIELKPKSAPGDTGPLKFDAVGALTIVGTTVTNTIPVTIEKTGGKLKIVGNIPLKCTDFKLQPFSFLLFSCGDDLKISFEWLLAAKAP